jgi:hypothetical protein
MTPDNPIEKRLTDTPVPQVRPGPHQATLKQELLAGMASSKHSLGGSRWRWVAAAAAACVAAGAILFVAIQREPNNTVTGPSEELAFAPASPVEAPPHAATPPATDSLAAWRFRSPTQPEALTELSLFGTRLLSERSLEQCVAGAKAIVVATPLDSAAAPPKSPGDAPESMIRMKVSRTLKGESPGKTISIRTPTAFDNFAGKEWVVLLSPEFLAGKHAFADCRSIDVAPQVAAILAKPVQDTAIALTPPPAAGMPVAVGGAVRGLYEDWQVVERSDLIVVGRLKKDSIKYISKNENSPTMGLIINWEHHATLVISQVLKGDFKPKETPLVIVPGLEPTIDGFFIKEGGKLEPIDPLIGPKLTGTRILGGYDGLFNWPPEPPPDLAEDCVWLLRRVGETSDTSAGADAFEIRNPEDIRSLAMKDYLMAYLAADPETAVPAQLAKLPDVPEMKAAVQRYLDHCTISHIVKGADSAENKARQLLPFYLRRDPWVLGTEARDALLTCGPATGPYLLGAFDDPKYKDLRPDMIHLWGLLKYRDCVPMLVDLLKKHDQFWAGQKLAKGWWNDSSDPDLMSQRRDIANEMCSCVYSLGKIGDPAGREVVELTKRRWEAINFENTQIVDACNQALQAIGAAPRTMVIAAKPPRLGDITALESLGRQFAFQPPPAAEVKMAPIAFSGRVVDDKTGEPVVHYTLQSGWPDAKDPSKVAWGGIESSGGPPDGKFSEKMTFQEGSKIWFRIIASGYTPQPITAEPLTAPAILKDLVVRMKRGEEISGRVLDAAGKPVSWGAVYLGGTQSIGLVDGTAEFFKGSSVNTDSGGRFTIAGAGAGSSLVIACGPPDKNAPKERTMVWLAAPPKAGEDIRLPTPAGLKIAYDIDGAAAAGKFWLELKTWEMPAWRSVVTFDLHPICANETTLTLPHLTPGVYDMARLAELRVGDSGYNFMLDRRTVTLEAGKTVEESFVRKTGSPIAGQVKGLAGSEIPGAYITVRSEKSSGDPEPAGDEWKLQVYDAVTCGQDGKFKTGRISPGVYTVAAWAYKPEPRDGVYRSGWRLPALVGTAKVVVPETGEAKAVEIELKPYTYTPPPPAKPPATEKTP